MIWISIFSLYEFNFSPLGSRRKGTRELFFRFNEEQESNSGIVNPWWSLCNLGALCGKFYFNLHNVPKSRIPYNPPINFTIKVNISL